jgi:uncharacterized membrane protein SirB2
MAEPRTQPPTSFLGRFKAYLRTLDGKANLAALVISGITAIFMTQILPETTWVGALGVLSIYFIVFLFIAGLAKMVIRRIDRRRSA